MDPYTCVKCGLPRRHDEAMTACPKCGGTGLFANVSCHMTGSSTMTVTPSLLMNVESDNWRTKWDSIQRRFVDLARPRTGMMGGESLRDAQNNFHSYFVFCYHLKDALIKEKPGPLAGMNDKLAKKTVDDLITASPALSLLADICNVIKHSVIDQKIWSGHVPCISAVSEISKKDGSWYITLVIDHAGQRRDGVVVAEAALSGWRTILSSWGVI